LGRIPEKNRRVFKEKFMSRFIKLSIFFFWIFMTVLFLKKELFPYFFAKEIRGYRKILPRDLLLQDSWYGIYFKEAKIGYAHTQIVVAEKKRASSYILTTQALLSLSILGEPQIIWLEAEANLDQAYLLKDFSFLLRLGHQKFMLQGHHTAGNRLHLKVATPAETTEREIIVPPDIVVGVLFSPFNILADLKQKERFGIIFFNPLTQKIEASEVQVLGKQRMSLADTVLDAFLIESSYQGSKTLSWIDADKGEILKQETPLGWKIIKEPQLEAMNFIRRGPSQGLDLALSLAVKSNISLPANLSYLRLRLKNLDPVFSLPQDNRQKLLQSDSKGAVIEIVSSVPAREKTVLPPINKDNFVHELASDIFIPADDAQIKAQAEQIIQGEKNSLRAVRLIAAWMQNNIQKRVTLSLPNALDVLRTKMGDCNEWTYLFAAFSRSIGVPTKIASGLVYLEGKFLYHMWPEVYVGEWLAMDPVLNQEIADVTHIKLVEGELASQLELAKILGKIEIEIIEFR
jgi:hypothetical protein